MADEITPAAEETAAETFYVWNGSSYRPVEGEPVTFERFEHVPFFLALDRGEWKVAIVDTGLLINGGETREGALENARQSLKSANASPVAWKTDRAKVEKTRGLSPAVAPREAPAPQRAEAPRQFGMVPRDQVHPSPLNPRKRFPEAGLQELAADIRAHGILEPLVVRPRKSEGFELIAGERRLRAAEIVGLDEVPVVVRLMDDVAALSAMISENVQREDLNPIEEAEAVADLLALGLTQVQAGTRVHKSQGAVSNLLRLLKLPDVARKAIIEGELSEKHGQGLCRFLAFPKVAARIAKVAVARDASANALMQGIPFADVLNQERLIVSLGWGTEFEWQGVCTKDRCPFHAYRKTQGGHRSDDWCLNPEHHDALRDAARAAKREATKKELAEKEEAKARLAELAREARVRDAARAKVEAAEEARQQQLAAVQASIEEAAADPGTPVSVPDPPAAAGGAVAGLPVLQEPAPEPEPTDDELVDVLSEIHKLPYDAYKEFRQGPDGSWDWPAGCKGLECPKLIASGNRRICLDRPCHEKFKKAAEREEGKARRGQREEILERIAAQLAAGRTPAETRTQVRRWLAAGTEHRLNGLRGADTVRALQLAGLGHWSPKLWETNTSPASTQERWETLSSLSLEQLAILAGAAAFLDDLEAMTSNQYYGATSHGRYRWFLGDEAPEEGTNFREAIKQMEPADRETYNAIRRACGLAPVVPEGEDPAPASPNAGVRAMGDAATCEECGEAVPGEVIYHYNLRLGGDPDSQCVAVHEADGSTWWLHPQTGWCANVDLGDPVPQCPKCQSAVDTLEALEGGLDPQCLRCGADLPLGQVKTLHQFLNDDEKWEGLFKEGEYAGEWFPLSTGALVGLGGHVYCAACAPQVQVCRQCGCTDELGCEAGCVWVAQDLCSECADMEEEVSSSIAEMPVSAKEEE